MCGCSNWRRGSRFPSAHQRNDLSYISLARRFSDSSAIAYIPFLRIAGIAVSGLSARTLIYFKTIGGDGGGRRSLWAFMQSAILRDVLIAVRRRTCSIGFRGALTNAQSDRVHLQADVFLQEIQGILCSGRRPRAEQGR